MNFTFRESDLISSRDNDAIVQLLNEFMFSDNSTGKIGLDIIPKLISLGNSKVYLCEADNNVIGIAMCFLGFSTYYQKELLNIHDFYIQDKYQGKGVGKCFLKYIEEDCTKNGICRITLEVLGDNANAIKVYKHCGFIGDAIDENNHIIYAMKKDLL